MHNCKEISENFNYSTELLREVKEQSFRYFILLMLSITLNIGMLGYFFFDRQLDSEICVESNEVVQDGVGMNIYHDGLGDVINGAESDEN